MWSVQQMISVDHVGFLVCTWPERMHTITSPHTKTPAHLEHYATDVCVHKMFASGYKSKVNARIAKRFMYAFVLVSARVSLRP